MDNDELIPLEKVLDDMYNPDGGIASMSAKDYYYQHYASEEEIKKHQRNEFIIDIIVRIILSIILSIIVFGTIFSILMLISIL